MEEYVRSKIFEEEYLNSLVVSIIGEARRQCIDKYNYWSEISTIKEYKYIKAIPFGMSNAVVLASANRINTINPLITSQISSLVRNTSIFESFFLIGGIIKAFSRFIKSNKLKQNLINRLGFLLSDVSKKIWENINPIVENVELSINEIRDNSFSRLYYDYDEMEDVKNTLAKLENIDNIDNMLSTNFSLSDILLNHKN